MSGSVPSEMRIDSPELKNKRFGAMADPKCDWRVNFRGMWGYVAILGVRESRVSLSVVPPRRVRNGR